MHCKTFWSARTSGQKAALQRKRLSRTSNRSQSSHTDTCGISLGGGARNSSWGIFLWFTKKTFRKSKSARFLPYRRPLVLGPPLCHGCTSRCPGHLLLCQEESLLVLLVGLVDIGRVELRDLQRIAAFVMWFTCPYKVFPFSGIPKVCQIRKIPSVLHVWKYQHHWQHLESFLPCACKTRPPCSCWPRRGTWRSIRRQSTPRPNRCGSLQGWRPGKMSIYVLQDCVTKFSLLTLAKSLGPSPTKYLPSSQDLLPSRSCLGGNEHAVIAAISLDS